MATLASVKKLLTSELMHKSIRTIQRSLKVLVKYGYIIIKRRVSMSYLYYIVAKMSSQAGQMVKEVIKRAENACKAYQKGKTTSSFNNFEGRKYNF